MIPSSLLFELSRLFTAEAKATPEDEDERMRLIDVSREVYERAVSVRRDEKELAGGPETIRCPAATPTSQKTPERTSRPAARSRRDRQPQRTWR